LPICSSIALASEKPRLGRLWDNGIMRALLSSITLDMLEHDRFKRIPVLLILFTYAITISVESILIEFLTTTFLQITPIMLSAISITLAGIMQLLVASFLMKKKRISALFLKSGKNLFLASIFLAVGIFTWYDSINRIGASKEVLIAGPLEIVIIVILARLFLNEKLKKIQITGIVLALIGFFISIVSDIGTDVLDGMQTVITSPLPSIPITFGDIEAILSAFGFGIGVLFLTKLVSLHSSIEVAGTSMLISGLILAGFMIGFSYESLQISLGVEGSLFQQPQMLINTIIIVALFSLLPFIGSLSYSTGLSRIGASITATIGSSSILITIIIQITLRQLGITSNLPENIILAIIGGIIGFLGIYIIHLHNHSCQLT
jgi:drug/metabolite transporter (DMT)-like permease